MRREIRTAAFAALLLATAGCTNSGVDPSGLAPLTSEQARSVAPPPPSTQTDLQRPALPGSSQPAAGQAVSDTASAGQTAQPTQMAAIAANARVEFAPVVGAPTDKVGPLAARLSARAAQRGIGVAAAGDPNATNVLKGYFSAFTDGGRTTVIYVWDVLDPAGNRLHRIQGQQNVTGSQGNGWNAVTPAAMEAIADRTIDDLAVWLSSRTG